MVGELSSVAPVGRCFDSVLPPSPDCVRLVAFARDSAVEEQTDDAARHRIAAQAAVPAKGGWHTGARGAASRRPRADAPVLLVRVFGFLIR